MFWRKKKRVDAALLKLHHQPIRSISFKDPTNYRETILGRDGVVNLTEDELIIVCGEAEVFRRSTACLQMAELMSRDGFTLRDLSDPDGITYMVYFVK